jgi:acetyl-CoA carboxylase carboxyl transferase subunit beta
VSKQAGVSKVPDDFQTSEFVFNHGMLDRIVPRRELRQTLVTLVRILGSNLSKEPVTPRPRRKKSDG